MSYLSLETAPKEQTSGSSIADGSVKMRHLSPELFLEIQLIKLHNHEGVTSVRLGKNASPYSIAGYQPTERVEHGVAVWTGVAAGSASVALTFGKAFRDTPEVFVTVQGRSSVDCYVTTNTPTTTGVTIYWALGSGTETQVDLTWLAIGR
jgi:hypothetical protein